jgi:hypothetical protein
VFKQKFTYGEGNKWSSLISVFSEFAKGERYSYTYGGDINGDGLGLNDLISIPTDAQIDQMAFKGDATAQRSALKAYIAQDKYLSGRGGEYTDKYGALSPWFRHIDLRFAQEYVLPEKNTIQLTLDILNAAILISSK